MMAKNMMTKVADCTFIKLIAQETTEILLTLMPASLLCETNLRNGLYLITQMISGGITSFHCHHVHNLHAQYLTGPRNMLMELTLKNLSK